MLIYLRVLKESFIFAVNALKNNKLRTFLSLVGVTIGIFSIIAILAAVDSLKQDIKGSLSGLDSYLVTVSWIKFGPSEVPRWKREQFPQVSYDEYVYLKNNLNTADVVNYTLLVFSPSTARYEDESISGVQTTPVTEQFQYLQKLDFKNGRFFNESESNSGAPVAVIGDEVADALFGSSDRALGKRIRVKGKKLTVIGVLEKEGQGLFGSNDTNIIFPVQLGRRIFGEKGNGVFPAINIKPKEGVDYPEFIAEIKQKLRIKRGLKYEEIDSFFINEIKGFTELIDNTLGSLTIAGWIIGAFSLLVGGFGIANIMFVSVKERTNLIGIQKSLGAKRRFILLQFLFEAMVLSVIGGLIGLIMVYLTTLGVNAILGDDSFTFVLSKGNMTIGVGVASFIGLIAGILPAISASRLDPVEAIRTGM